MTDFRYEGDPRLRSSRRVRRGKQALVGVVGLAALTAGGLFLVTEVIPTKDRAVAELGAGAPVRPQAPDPGGMPPADPIGSASTGAQLFDTLDAGPAGMSSADPIDPGPAGFSSGDSLDSDPAGMSSPDSLGGVPAEAPDATGGSTGSLGADGMPGPDSAGTLGPGAGGPGAGGTLGPDSDGLPGQDSDGLLGPDSAGSVGADAAGAAQAGESQAEPAPPPSPPVLSAVAPQRSPVPFMSPSMSLAQRVVIVRAAGVPVPAPIPQQIGVAVAQRSVTVTDDGSIEREGATLRVVSAPGNLTGQRELAWVADGGQRVGDAFCSQRFYFGAGLPAGENPALMVCWKLSVMRSVYTVAVNANGRPSAPFSVAALDREWARLGPVPLPPFQPPGRRPLLPG